MRVYFWDLCYIPLVCYYASTTVLITIVVICIEIRKCEVYNSILFKRFFKKIVLTTWGSLRLWIDISVFAKNC